MPKFSIKDRLLSFKYAFNGLKILIYGEHNVWIHLAISTIAIILGIYFGISCSEWATIVLSIGIVISAEIFNTAIEHISNFVQPNHDIRIKNIKDLGSAGVLICAMAAFIVGVTIFLPKIIALI